MGIDLGGTKIAGVLLDAHGQTLAQARLPTPQGDYRGTLDAIARLVAELEASAAALGHAGAEPLSVGIGTPGVRLPHNGLMTSCNSVCLNGQPLLEDLIQLLQRPLQLANDADCFALSEWRRYQDAKDPAALEAVQTSRDGLWFGVILGTGVGGGWVHQGHLLAGPNGLAGEWGHTPLPYFQQDSGLPTPLFELELRLADRHCYCGRKNCIETFLSGPGLQQIHQELWRQSLAPEVLAKAWVGSDQLHDKIDAVEQASASIALYINMLARTLAQVVNLMDPACIVLGGGLSSMGFLYEELPKQMLPYLFSREHCATRILPPLGGAGSGVFGAAALVGGSSQGD